MEKERGSQLGPLTGDKRKRPNSGRSIGKSGNRCDQACGHIWYFGGGWLGKQKLARRMFYHYRNRIQRMMITHLWSVGEIPRIHKEFAPNGEHGENQWGIVDICVLGTARGVIQQWAPRYLYGEKTFQTGACYANPRQSRVTSGMGIVRKLNIAVRFGGDQSKVGHSEWRMMTFNEKHHLVFPLVPTASA